MIKSKETALILKSCSEIVLIKTEIEFGNISINKYAWFFNKNQKNEYIFITESSQKEWDELSISDNYKIDIVNENDKEIYCLWTYVRNEWFMVFSSQCFNDIINKANEVLVERNEFNMKRLRVLKGNQDPASTTSAESELDYTIIY